MHTCLKSERDRSLVLIILLNRLFSCYHTNQTEKLGLETGAKNHLQDVPSAARTNILLAPHV